MKALGPVLARWTMGGGAAAAAPTEWRSALGEDATEAELRLLALSGQFLGAFVLAEPVGEVQALPDIPALARPPLPDALRPRLRRLLQQLREPAQRRSLLDFVDTRGWTLHPGDWMPRPGDDVPDVYAPWQDWPTALDATQAATGTLTAETWDGMGPATRRVAFAALRRQDPARSSALLAERIAGETADARAGWVEALATGLCEADRPLLETLATDRALRVTALASSMLARLGHRDVIDADAVELAGFFPVQIKGLLRRIRSIAPQELKTPAQRNRRSALMATTSFGGFAGALKLSSEELVAAWPWASDRAADHALAAMAARSAPDTVIVAMTETMTTRESLDPYGLAPLLPRLAPARRRRAAVQMLRAKGSAFPQALSVVGGDGRIEAAIHTVAGAALLSALRAEEAKPSDQSAELLALGLIASRAAATQALEELAAAGLIAADPRLDMLRLNAALEDRSDQDPPRPDVL